MTTRATESRIKLRRLIAPSSRTDASRRTGVPEWSVWSNLGLSAAGYTSRLTAPGVPIRSDLGK